MARGLNKVIIIGLVGRDPEMRFTPSGRPVTSFSVATSRTWVSAEGEGGSVTLRGGDRWPAAGYREPSPVANRASSGR